MPIIALTLRTSESGPVQGSTSASLNQVVLTVTSISDNKVRLGFEADKSVRIDRQEVRERIDDGEDR